MAKFSRARGSTGNMLVFFLPDSASTTGAGKTGLTNASAGLNVSWRRELSSTMTSATGANIGAIATLGTWVDPGAGKVNFKEVDAANAPGLYEVHFQDTVFGTGDASRLLTGMVQATGIAPVPFEVELTAANNQDGTRGGLTALPAFAPGAAGGLLIAGTNAATTFQGADAVGATPATAGLTVKGGAASTTGGGTSAPGVQCTGGSGAASTNGPGHGFTSTGGSITTVFGAVGMLLQGSGTSQAHGLRCLGAGNGAGAYFTATGSSAALVCDGSTLTPGMQLQGSLGLRVWSQAGGAPALEVKATTGNAPAAAFTGFGNGDAITATGSGTGNGLTLQGGAASGASAAGHGLSIVGGTASTTGGGSAGQGINVIGGTGAASTNVGGIGFKVSGGGNAGAGGNHGVHFVASGSGSGFMCQAPSGGGYGINADAGSAGIGINAAGGQGMKCQGNSGTGLVVAGGGGNAHAATFTGSSNGSGMVITAGTGAAGLSVIGGSVSGSAATFACTVGDGITATGNGTGHGINATGNATNGDGIRAFGGGTGNGIDAKGGASNGAGLLVTAQGTGNGLDATGGAGGGAGIKGTGAGGYPGFFGIGGAGGDGAAFTAGASGRYGLNLLGNAANPGLFCQGGATGRGASFVSGTGSNLAGLYAQGDGTAPGFLCQGGATGDGARFVGGATSGIGLHAVGTGGLADSNLVGDAWDELMSGHTIPGSTAAALAAASTGGGGMAVQGTWNYSTNTTMADPGSGKFRINTALFTTATQIALDYQTGNNFDFSNYLRALDAGDSLFMQDASNAANWARYTLTSPPADQGGWWLLSVVFVGGTGTAPNNNSPCALQFRQPTTLPTVDGKPMPTAIAIIAALAGGKASGAGTGTETFIGLDGTTTRAVVTVDNQGNRTAVVYP